MSAQEKPKVSFLMEKVFKEKCFASEDMKRLGAFTNIAGHASNGMKRQGKYAVDELERFFKGEEIRCRVKKEKFDVIA